VQRRVVIRAELTRAIKEAIEAQQSALDILARSVIARCAGDNVPRVRLGELIGQVRRDVDVSPSEMYREIGIRSHGRGIFHKNPVQGIQLGDKAIYQIEPGDFVLNIVFAWEGAIALAGDSERGMVGSHRFPTFRAIDDRLDLSFLVLILQTAEGADLLMRVSPGSAGRNRTLSKSDFLKGTIPLPSMDDQKRCVQQVSLIRAMTERLDVQKIDLDGLSRALVSETHSS